MTACSRKSLYFILVVFYVLIVTFGISRFNPDPRLDSWNEPDIEMNQIPQDPWDSSSEEHNWGDQDLINKCELVTPVFTEESKDNSLILLFYKRLFHPVFSPPPETSPV
jgi:hypothetical protein